MVRSDRLRLSSVPSGNRTRYECSWAPGACDTTPTRPSRLVRTFVPSGITILSWVSRIGVPLTLLSEYRDHLDLADDVPVELFEIARRYPVLLVHRCADGL